MANKEKQAENKEKIGIGAWLALIVLILVLSGAFRTAEGPIKVLDFTNLAGSFGQIGDTGANLIGKGGTEVDKLKEELKKVTSKDVQINIFEVKRPEVDAHIVADSIARQIEGRVSYRRAIKMAVANTMRLGAEGIKVLISGRVGGAEMARNEMFKEGRTPLHTFRADIDYALAVANTKVGALGIKVWICNGERYGKQDLTPAALSAANAQAAGQNRGGRGEQRRGGRPDRRPRRDNQK